MTSLERLQQFVQDVYLTRYNRFIDDITDEDGLVEVTKTVRWTNMFLDELEREADWEYVRTNNEDLGTIVTPSQVFALPAAVRKLVVNEERPLILMQGDSVISRFEVVDPNQITRRSLNDGAIDRVATVNGNLVFSRTFSDYEIGADVIADSIHYIPRLVESPIDVTLFDTVEPYNLLVLGVAKNATLPDIVQGGLSPSFVQRYANELEKAVAENNASSTSDEAVYDDYTSIGGIY